MTPNWAEWLKNCRAGLPFRKTREMGLKKFNKDKHNVLYLGQKMSLQAEDWLDRLQLCRKEPVDSCRQQVEHESVAPLQQKFNYILPYISKSIPNKSKKLVIPLRSTIHKRCGQTADTSIKMTEELENMTYQQRLKELSLLSLEKQRLTAVFHYLWSGREEELQSK